MGSRIDSVYWTANGWEVYAIAEAMGPAHPGIESLDEPVASISPAGPALTTGGWPVNWPNPIQVFFSGLTPGAAYTLTIHHVWHDLRETYHENEVLTFWVPGESGPAAPDAPEPPAVGGLADAAPRGCPWHGATARMGAAGGAYDGRRRGWEVRAYRLAGGAWRRTRLPMKDVLECEFTHRRDGGMSQCEVSTHLPIGAEPWLRPHDRLSVWVRAARGWVEWWRGYVGETRRNTARPDALEVTAYGGAALMKAVRVRRQYAMAAEDLSALVDRLLTEYADPWYVEMGYPLPRRDVRRVDRLVGETRALDGTLFDVLSDLVSSVPGVTWGMEIGPDGEERWYLRPLPTEALYVAALGKDATTAAFHRDAESVVNALTIEGGTPLYPNLLTNGGFERPRNEGANLAPNPSFEDVRQGKKTRALHWNVISGDPTVKSEETRVGDDSLTAASGGGYLELDNYGGGEPEEVQSDPFSVAGGERHVFRVAMAAEDSRYPCQPYIRILPLDSTGSALPEIEVTAPGVARDGYPNGWVADDQQWKDYRYEFEMPADAAAAKVLLRLPAGQGGRKRGMGIDNVRVVPAGLVSQEGWVLNANTDAYEYYTDIPPSLAGADWAVPGGREGAWCVRVRWETGADAACFAGIASKAVDTGGNVQLRLSLYARNMGASAVTLRTWLWESDGETWRRCRADNGTNDWVTVPADGMWHRHHVDFTTRGGTKQVSALLGGAGVSSAGECDVDAVYLHVGWPEELLDFVEGGGTPVYRVSTEDGWFQDPEDPLGRYALQEARDSAWWHSGALAGTVHHGRREERVSAPKVQSPEDARRYAVNFFNQRAIERMPSPVEIADRIRNIKADGLLRLVNVR